MEPLDIYERAIELFEAGKYPEAESLLKNIISSHPHYADVHNKLGIIAHHRGDLRGASEYSVYQGFRP